MRWRRAPARESRSPLVAPQRAACFSSAKEEMEVVNQKVPAAAYYRDTSQPSSWAMLRRKSLAYSWEGRLSWVSSNSYRTPSHQGAAA